jgi:hypothetical protein
MSATYKSDSPYYGTPQWGQFLDLWNPKSIPTDVTDVNYQLDPAYNLRPDLLAYDMYNDAGLWWVFAVRNPDIIQDPIFDFVAPIIIVVPNKTIVVKALGL